MSCHWWGRALLPALVLALVGGKALAADEPPTVEFKKETLRHPDPKDELGQGDPKLYEWDDMPLTLKGRIMVIYHAKSERGIWAVNLRYRVLAEGVAATDYPEEYRKITQPQNDPKALVFAKLPLKPVVADPKLGKFVSDLGLFEKSWEGLDGRKLAERFNVNVDLYVLPGGKEAGGRYNLLASELRKTVPDGKGGVKNAKLAFGDTIELFVEVLDKGMTPDGKPDPTRPAGYTKAKRKTVVTDDEAFRLLREQREKKNKKDP